MNARMPSLQPRGFTLVESLVVLAITAILMAVAVPQFQSFSTRRAIDVHISSLASSIRLARSEAIARGAPVTMCRSDAPEAAQPACNNADSPTGWATGWLVFVDRDQNGQVAQGVDVLLRVQPAITNLGGLMADGNGAYTLTFQRSGISLNAAQGFTFNPPLPVTHPNYASFQRFMCVEATGRTRLNAGAPCP